MGLTELELLDHVFFAEVHIFVNFKYDLQATEICEVFTLTRGICWPQGSFKPRNNDLLIQLLFQSKAQIFYIMYNEMGHQSGMSTF